MEYVMSLSGVYTSPPSKVIGLLSGFLSRLPLPRLVHFLDMILPQMVPVKSLPVVLALATSWKSGVEATTMWLNCRARSAIYTGLELALPMF